MSVCEAVSVVLIAAHFLPADRLAGMRTAVVRVDVDPSAELAPAQLTEGMTTLSELAEATGAEVIDADLAALPRRPSTGRVLDRG